MSAMIIGYPPTGGATFPGLYLRRLAELVARVAGVTPARRFLLHRAIFALFLDCRALGLEAEALAILQPLGVMLWRAA